MRCGLCGREIGRVKVYDALRRRLFCSEHCSRRYQAILWLWARIREED